MGKIGKHNDLFVIVVIFMVALFFEYRETFSLIEDETLSYRQLLRTYNADANLTSPADDIVIVYTDEEFYEEYDKYPLRRVDLSTILIRLKEMGASVIAVDMLLDFKSAYGEDPSLEDAFIEAGNALLVSQAQFENELGVALFLGAPCHVQDLEAYRGFVKDRSVHKPTLLELDPHQLLHER